MYILISRQNVNRTASLARKPFCPFFQKTATQDF